MAAEREASESPGWAEPRGAAGAEPRKVGARPAQVAAAVEQVAAVEWRRDAAAESAAERRVGPVAAGVVAERRWAAERPANSHHNIRRICFPREMSCDNSGRSPGGSPGRRAPARAGRTAALEYFLSAGALRTGRRWPQTPDSSLRTRGSVCILLFLVHLSQDS